MKSEERRGKTKKNFIKREALPSTIYSLFPWVILRWIVKSDILPCRKFLSQIQHKLQEKKNFNPDKAHYFLHRYLTRKFLTPGSWIS